MYFVANDSIEEKNDIAEQKQNSSCCKLNGQTVMFPSSLFDRSNMMRRLSIVLQLVVPFSHLVKFEITTVVLRFGILLMGQLKTCLGDSLKNEESNQGNQKCDSYEDEP